MKATIDKYLGGVLVFLMVIMTVDVLWGVFTRYVMGNQASWSEELARYLMIWIGILGAAYASGQKLHLAIDLLKPRLTPSRANAVNLLIAAIVIFFAVTVMLIGGGRFMYITQKLGQMSPALNIPKFYVYMVIPLAAIIIIVYQSIHIRSLLSGDSGLTKEA